MAYLQGYVAVEEVDENAWRLLRPVIYSGRDQTFEVPVGFVTDFASVPAAFTWLVPRYGVYTKAAVLHDFLCDGGLVSRADADGIFRRSMRELGVSLLRRWVMWAAVRLHSRLRGISAREFAIWLAVAIPATVFLLVPALVVVVWSALFWVGEAVVFGFERLLHREANAPHEFGVAGH
jgi:hypothetical protein